MTRYQPEQHLTNYSGILISTCDVLVKKKENLVLLWNVTQTEIPVTNIAYRVVDDKTQIYDLVTVRNRIPWSGSSHTVEITIYTNDPDNPTFHTSNNSDDADIKKPGQK